MSTLQQRFGMRLKMLRVANGLTQEQFAERAEVSTGLISSIERGIYQPSFKNIERFSSILDVKVRDLFDFDAIGKFQETNGVRVRAPRRPSTLVVRHRKASQKPSKPR